MATAITATDVKTKQDDKSPKKTEKLLAEGFTVKARMKNVEVSSTEWGGDKWVIYNLSSSYLLFRCLDLRKLAHWRNVRLGQHRSENSTIEGTFQLRWSTTPKETRLPGRCDTLALRRAVTHSQWAFFSSLGWNRQAGLPPLSSTIFWRSLRNYPSIRIFCQARSSWHAGAWWQQDFACHPATYHPSQKFVYFGIITYLWRAYYFTSRCTEHSKQKSNLHDAKSPSASCCLCRPRRRGARALLSPNFAHSEYLQVVELLVIFKKRLKMK